MELHNKVPSRRPWPLFAACGGWLRMPAGWDSRARRDFCHPVMRLISRALYAALVPNRFGDFWRERSTRQAKTEVAVEWAEKTIQRKSSRRL
jgi:hypothetical protein